MIILPISAIGMEVLEFMILGMIQREKLLVS